MGYIGNPMNPPHQKAQFQKFVPDRPGLKAWLRNWWQNHWYSDLQKAAECWRIEQTHFPPPAPMPTLELQINGKTFMCDSRGVEELQNGR